MAVIEHKKIHFGDKMYEDYTMHKNEARKNYIYQDINMIILITLYIRRSTQLICCGIKKH